MWKFRLSFLGALALVLAACCWGAGLLWVAGTLAILALMLHRIHANPFNRYTSLEIGMPEEELFKVMPKADAANSPSLFERRYVWRRSGLGFLIGNAFAFRGERAIAVTVRGGEITRIEATP